MSTQEQYEIKFDSKLLESEVKNGHLELKYTDKDIYNNQCPVDKKTMTQLATYQKEYVKSAGEFFAKEAEKAFKKDKSINTITVTAPFDYNSLGYLEGRFKREYTWNGIGDSEGGKKTQMQLKAHHVVEGAPKPFIKNLEKDLTKAILNIDL